MITVAALTSGRNDPSSRFRVQQFLEPLSTLGIAVVEYRPWVSKYASWPIQLTGLGVVSRLPGLRAARQANVTWLNRELIHGHDSFERFLGSRCVFDVDDAIWLTARSNFAKRIAQRCAGVIAANRTIATYFAPFARRLWIVPTSVDTSRWRPARRIESDRDGEFVVAWSGTRWNLPHLYSVEDPLSAFLHDHPGSRLRVICDRRPSFASVPPDRWSFVRWSSASEVRALHNVDVGIMPLVDTEWTRAKSALKMVCYLAMGCPVVVSPVGVAAEILQQAQASPVGLAAHDAQSWYDGLHRLYENRPLARAMGRSGPDLVERAYSVAHNAPRLAQIFGEVAGSCQT